MRCEHTPDNLREERDKRSPKGFVMRCMECKRAYNKSEKGLATHRDANRRYDGTAKGLLTRIRCHAKERSG